MMLQGSCTLEHTELTRTSARKAAASPLNVRVMTGTLPTMAAAVAPPPGSGPPKGGGVPSGSA